MIYPEDEKRCFLWWKHLDRSRAYFICTSVLTAELGQVTNNKLTVAVSSYKAGTGRVSRCWAPQVFLLTLQSANSAESSRMKSFQRQPQQVYHILFCGPPTPRRSTFDQNPWQSLHWLQEIVLDVRPFGNATVKSICQLPLQVAK